ncbi:MAG: M56 family metallopeptidase [Clostridiales bacterium]|nr:M56 family metallopeptidase [Clostridiales bacterium]
MGAFFEALVNHSDRIFSALLNRAVAATLLILAVCVYRALSPKAPKWTRLFLWALAGLRLCLPFSIQSAWSLVPSEKILDYETAQYAAKPEITSGIAALNRAVNPAFGESLAATPAASVNPLQVWMHLAGLVWAIGVLALLLLALVSVRRIRRRVRASIELQKGVRLCDAIDTPFLLGLFRPTVYLPSQLSQQERDVVLAHEAAHKTHGDCVWKGLGYGILCVYWFYPPVWLGYALFCRDLELACDERAVKRLSLEEKKRYASVLLSCSVPRGSFPVCPLAFGEVGVKERVKRVLDKKPAKALIALALAVCLVIGVCFLTAKQDEQIYGLSAGSYVMDEADAVQILPSQVTFRMSGNRHEFVFMLSPISSYYMAGEFTMNDGFVTCSDGLYTLVFKIQDNDTIVLQIPDQDGLHMSGLFIPNGTEFYYEAPDDSRLIFYKQESTTGELRADFRLDFGEALDYGEVWAECWQDGVCTKSEPLVLNREDEQLHLSFQVQGSEAQNAPAVQVSMQSGASDAVLTRFALPETMLGFGFKSYEDGQEIYPYDGDTYVLAAFAPDLGDGIPQYECIDLSMEPAFSEQAACMVLVKAVFGSGEFPH